MNKKAPVKTILLGSTPRRTAGTTAAPAVTACERARDLTERLRRGRG
jgi:hypothetical protein